MKIIYVYILKCSDNTFYTGVTNDMDRRLKEHHSGIHKDSYTYSRRPITLVYHERFSDPALAIKWEKRIKKWSQKKKKALIDGDWDKLVEYSKSKSNDEFSSGSN
jgi:putative endonuclease